MAERRQPLKIEVPSSKDDNVRYGRVGIIVAVGFVIGIVWPRLAGIKLVPSAPTPAGESATEASKPQASASAAATQSAKPSAAAEPPASQPETSEAAPAASNERVRINEPQFVSCRSKDGKRAEQCDALEIDSLARARIQTLAFCEGAERVQGVLSLGLDLDFESETIKRLSLGRSTSIPSQRANQLLTCARREFEKVSLTGIKHEHATYSVFYRIEFLPPGAKADAADGPAPEGESPEVTEASGRATVSWDVALVRSEPKKDGAVVARILQGTRVGVTGRRGDWYRVKYDAKGSQGWVFRTAIGM